LLRRDDMLERLAKSTGKTEMLSHERPIFVFLMGKTAFGTTASLF